MTLARRFLARIALWLGIWIALFAATWLLVTVLGRGGGSAATLVERIPATIAFVAPVAAYLAAMGVAPEAARAGRGWTARLLAIATLAAALTLAAHLGAVALEAPRDANLLDVAARYDAALATAGARPDVRPGGFSPGRQAAGLLAWTLHFPLAAAVVAGLAAVLGALVGTWLAREDRPRAWAGWLGALVLVGYGVGALVIGFELTVHAYVPPLVSVWGFVLAPALAALALAGPVSLLRRMHARG